MPDLRRPAGVTDRRPHLSLIDCCPPTQATNGPGCAGPARSAAATERRSRQRRTGSDPPARPNDGVPGAESAADSQLKRPAVAVEPDRHWPADATDGRSWIAAARPSTEGRRCAEPVRGARWPDGPTRLLGPALRRPFGGPPTRRPDGRWRLRRTGVEPRAWQPDGRSRLRRSGVGPLARRTGGCLPSRQTIGRGCAETAATLLPRATDGFDGAGAAAARRRQRPTVAATSDWRRPAFATD